MNYWKVIFATAVIFGAGVLTGGLLVNDVNHSHAKNPRRPQVNNVAHQTENRDHAQQRPLEIPMPRLADKIGKQFIQQLDDQLALTPQQFEKIGKIVAEGQERNHVIWTNVAPQMRAVIQDVNQKIRAELTPEQQQLYEELLKHPPRRAGGTNAPAVLSAPTNSPATNPPGV